MNNQKLPWEDESSDLPASTHTKPSKTVRTATPSSASEPEELKKRGKSPSVHTSEFKLTVILETLRGSLTQREIGEKYNIPQPLVSLWKSSAIEAIRDDLDGRKRRKPERPTVASPLDHLLAAADEQSIERLCDTLRSTASQIESTLAASSKASLES